MTLQSSTYQGIVVYANIAPFKSVEKVRRKSLLWSCYTSSAFIRSTEDQRIRRLRPCILIHHQHTFHQRQRHEAGRRIANLSQLRIKKFSIAATSRESETGKMWVPCITNPATLSKCHAACTPDACRTIGRTDTRGQRNSTNLPLSALSCFIILYTKIL